MDQPQLKHFNKATLLVIFTVALSGLQSWWMHIATSCYAHEIFSVYFYMEVVVLLWVLSTGLKNRWSAAVYDTLLAVEISIYIITERPYSPDSFLMVLIGIIRIYVLYWLFKQLNRIPNQGN